jgi:hypothetical protein
MAQEFTRNIKNLTTAQVHGKEIKEFTDVNDIVSNDKDNFIKMPNEKMHCLTDNIKLIYKTENTELLDIELDNTKNSAKLKVNHDEQKEQRLFSSNKSIYLIPAVNGTGDKTDIQVTPLDRQNYVDGNDNKVYIFFDEVNRIINIFALKPFTVSASATEKTITLYYLNNGSTLPQLEGEKEFGQYVTVNESHIIIKYKDGKTHYDEWDEVDNLLVHVKFDVIVQ